MDVDFGMGDVNFDSLDSMCSKITFLLQQERGARIVSNVVTYNIGKVALGISAYSQRVRGTDKAVSMRECFVQAGIAESNAYHSMAYAQLVFKYPILVAFQDCTCWDVSHHSLLLLKACLSESM